MVKAFIAYGELIFGLPILVASLLSFVPTLLITTTIGQRYPLLFAAIEGILEGTISILFACFVFRWLDVPLNLAVPIILVVVTYAWDSKRKETNRTPFAAAGIVIGYVFW